MSVNKKNKICSYVKMSVGCIWNLEANKIAGKQKKEYYASSKFIQKPQKIYNKANYFSYQ